MNLMDLNYDREQHLDNGNIIYYRVKDGTSFQVGTYLADENRLADYSRNIDDRLINILNCYIGNKRRVRVWIGDGQTGRAWMEEYDVTGVMGRSSGRYKIPILLNNRRSSCGGSLFVDCILRIDDIADKRTVYQADNFYIPEMSVKHEQDKYGYNWRVYQEGANIASFKTEDKARRWIDFMTGKRYNK